MKHKNYKGQETNFKEVTQSRKDLMVNYYHIDHNGNSKMKLTIYNYMGTSVGMKKRQKLKLFTEVRLLDSMKHRIQYVMKKLINY